MPDDDPIQQEQQRQPDPYGDRPKPEQSTESQSNPFMISNQGVNDQFFETLRRDAPFPQQQVLFNLSLPTCISRTHSSDGLGGPAGSHSTGSDGQCGRSASGARGNLEDARRESKSGDHAAAMAVMPLHQSLGKDMSLAAQLHSRHLGSAGVPGETQRRSSDPFVSHVSFPSALSSLREGSSSNEFNSTGLRTRDTSERSLPPKVPPKAPEPAAPIDPGTGKQVCTFYMRTGTCAYRDRCKFHHPLNCPPPILNSHGYPLRAEESDCVHYTKKGWCAFGVTCKYNHPEGIAASPLAPTLTTLGTSPRVAVAPVPAGMPSPMVFGLAQQPQLVLPQQQQQQQQQLQSMVIQQQLQEPALWGSQPPQQQRMVAAQQQQQQQALYWAVASDPDSSYSQQQLPQPQPQLMTQMPAMQPSAYMPAMQPVTFPQQQQQAAGQLVYAPAGMLTMPGGIAATGGQGMPMLSQGMPVLSQGLLALSEPTWGATGGGGRPVGSIQTASIEQAMAQLQLPSQVQHPDTGYAPEGGGGRWM